MTTTITRDVQEPAFATQIGIPRNDVAFAVKTIKARLLDGSLTPSTMQSLLFLQDDPKDLRSEIAKIARDPETANIYAAYAATIGTSPPSSSADDDGIPMGNDASKFTWGTDDIVFGDDRNAGAKPNSDARKVGDPNASKYAWTDGDVEIDKE